MFFIKDGIRDVQVIVTRGKFSQVSVLMCIITALNTFPHQPLYLYSLEIKGAVIDSNPIHFMLKKRISPHSLLTVCSVGVLRRKSGAHTQPWISKLGNKASSSYVRQSQERRRRKEMCGHEFCGGWGGASEGPPL